MSSEGQDFSRWGISTSEAGPIADAVRHLV
eukprot:COSAG04_NODE_150_length_22521_cov_10.008385_2_plen_30_part_00